MAVRIRTYKRIGRGVSVVSYQSPKQYLLGLIFGFAILIAIVHAIFGSWTQWVIAAAVFIIWLSSIVSGGLVAKFLWSVALLFTVYMIWASNGCAGNTEFCEKIKIEAEADRKASAIKKAQSDMEICSAISDWQNDSDCRIYSQNEIAAAKARVKARSDAEEREARDEAEKEQQSRLNEAIKNRDASRASIILRK